MSSKLYLKNIYDAWICAREAKKAAFPMAICVDSSHIGGIRVRRIIGGSSVDFTDWFKGLYLSADSCLSQDRKHRCKYVRVGKDNIGVFIDIDEIRIAFEKLRKLLQPAYRSYDLIWGVARKNYWLPEEIGSQTP